MLKRIIPILVILFCAKYHAQSISGDYKQKSFTTYHADFVNLFKKCKSSRLDSIYKVCLPFMNDYGIRKDAKKLYSFSSMFIKRCKQEHLVDLEKRIQIITLTNTLRLNNAPNSELEKKFHSFFVQLFNQNDYSAALECLFEKAMIYDKREDKIEALKILFFCEKFASSYHLTNDLCYQRVLHEIAHKLLYFEKNKLAINYFKRSLQTGYSSVMDSLVSLNGIGLAYQELNLFKSSNQYLKKASKTALRAKNYLFNNVINGNIAHNKFRLGKLEESYHYAYLEKNTSLANKLWSNSVESMCLIANIELQRKQLLHAKVLLDSINVFSDSISPTDYALNKKMYEINYLYHKEQKDAKRALYAFEKLNYFDKLFQNEANKDKISMLQFKASNEVFNLEMKKIESRKKTKNLLIIISFLFLGGVILYLVYYFFQKIKKIEKSKSEIKEINERQLVEIENLRKQLLEQIAYIKNNFSPSSEDSENVFSLKEYNLSKKEQWEAFKSLFLQTYPYFQTKVSLHVDALSNSELRLLMLHKLGLSNKEIAEALFISLEGVKKANYRLYKKFKVNSSIELIALFE